MKENLAHKIEGPTERTPVRPSPRSVTMSSYYARRGAKRRKLGHGSSRRSHRVSSRTTRSFVPYKRKWRPYRKTFYKKRVATRLPTPAAIPSPYKSNKELLLSNLWSGPVASGNFDRSSIPTTDGNWACAFLLSPLRTEQTYGDRKVEGDKARLLSANVQYIFANKMQTNLTVRMTVLELKSELAVFAGGTVNWTTSTYLNRLFKDEHPGVRIIDFKSWLNASGRERDFYAMNTSEFKILKQKIVKLGGHGPTMTDNTSRPSVQGVHMYVKMNRLLDKNDEVTSQENALRLAYGTTPTADYERYSYYKPILVLVDVIPEVGREISPESRLVDIERCVKYTWRDAV